MSRPLQNLVIFILFIFIVDGAPSQFLSTIFFRLYTSNDVNPFIDEYLENTSNLVAHIDTRKKTVIYIHGFTESINSSSVRAIVDGYLARQDHNILAVDWSVLARENYFQVVSHVEDVGTQVANAITSMLAAGIPLGTIHIIGHSMGAQIAGAVGRKCHFKLSRITGLDPAGPLFNLLQSPLSASDAKFVDIIHTDAGLYGIARITGTVDFWPNRGIRLQPGCPENAQFYTPEGKEASV
ncbi:pancreatic triacylglycerol lipase-like isoform X2 [Chelonus insularis]|uniref:pancreatic triacylglycerol lipase-like isoform X2 n=1 Tax=Chelonus insularis TaxID=460826 RepID=UPI00158E1354|nr:pancreatic triacylglycerol lipase-like isoform X2 [Chelonus insularis]